MNTTKQQMGEGNAPRIAIAVRKGKFQAQLIAYNLKGVSTVTPISSWTTLAEANRIKAQLV